GAVGQPAGQGHGKVVRGGRRAGPFHGFFPGREGAAAPAELLIPRRGRQGFPDTSSRSPPRRADVEEAHAVPGRLRVRPDRRDDIRQGICDLAEVLITVRFLEPYGLV